MKGARSTKKFFRQLNHLILLTLQGSSTTTAQQIAALLDRATQLQRDNPTGIVLICFDEAGLPKDGMRVLKALHEPLDKGEVAFVCLSNILRDPANQNRMLTVRREAESDEDVKHLAYGCLGGCERSLAHLKETGGRLGKCVQDVSAEPQLHLSLPISQILHVNHSKLTARLHRVSCFAA